MSSVPQVRVGVIGHAMWLIGNHTHVCAIQVHKYNNQITLGFASCNYLTVTSTIILKLHSIVCNYLYKFFILGNLANH